MFMSVTLPYFTYCVVQSSRCCLSCVKLMMLMRPVISGDSSERPQIGPSLTQALGGSRCMGNFGHLHLVDRPEEASAAKRQPKAVGNFNQKYRVHWGTLPRGQNRGILPKEAWRLPRTPWSKLIFFSLFSCLVWQWPGVQIAPSVQGGNVAANFGQETPLRSSKPLRVNQDIFNDSFWLDETCTNAVLTPRFLDSFNYMYDMQLPGSTVAVKNCGLVKNSIVVIPLLLKKRWKPEKATIVPPKAMTKISVQTSHSLVQKVISVWKACAIAADTSQRSLKLSKLPSISQASPTQLPCISGWGPGLDGEKQKSHRFE